MPSATSDELLAELKAIRGAIEDANEALKHKASRGSVLGIGLSVILSLIVAVGGILYGIDSRHNLCVSGNDGRDEVRGITRDVMVEGAEAIIAVAPDAEPETVEQFRMEARQRGDEIASRLRDQNC